MDNYVNAQTMFALVQSMQRRQLRSLKVPQQRLVINPTSRQISEKKIWKKLTNKFTKRYLRPEVSPVRTFCYGTTTYEEHSLQDDIYLEFLAMFGNISLEERVRMMNGIQLLEWALLEQ